MVLYQEIYHIYNNEKTNNHPSGGGITFLNDARNLRVISWRVKTLPDLVLWRLYTECKINNLKTL